MVTQDVQASVEVARAVANRIQRLSQRLVDRKVESVSIGKREFKIAADRMSRLQERDDGRSNWRIVLEASDGPIPLKVTLARKDDGSGRLTVTFSPSRMLAAIDVAPTLSTNGEEAPKLPASSIDVNRELLGLGFDLLDRLCAEERRGRFLFDEPGLDNSEIRLERVRWDLFLRTSDPQRFLQLLPLIFEPVLKGSGGKVVKLGELLHLKPTHDIDPNTGEVSRVSLTRIQGERRKLMSIDLSRIESDDAAASGEMGKAVAGKVTRLQGLVRVSVTTYPDGIASLVTAGQEACKNHDWGDDEIYAGFVEDEPVDRTVQSLTLAIDALAQTHGSFPKYLATKIIRDTLCLDVISGFTHEGLGSFVGLDDPVALAWRRGGSSTMDNKALALAAKVSTETVRRRLQEWREKYKIHLRIPHAIYDALVTLAPIGATDVKTREALAAALAKKESAQTFELMLKALEGFEETRLTVIGPAVESALAGRLGHFRVEEVTTAIKVPAKRAVAKSRQVGKSANSKRKGASAKSAASIGPKERRGIARPTGPKASKPKASTPARARSLGRGEARTHMRRGSGSRSAKR
jgi:hypothetical protein